MIVQVGSYPPPIGGISVYIQRMKDFLDSEGIKNQVWDYHNLGMTKENIFHRRFFLIPFYYGVMKDIDIIHYNISGIKTKNYIGFFNRFLFKQRKKIITIHGNCKELFSNNNKLIVKSLNSFDAIVCVKNGDRELLLSKGITSDIYEISAFIPPTIQEQDIKKIDEEVYRFIANHKPILSANASRIVFYKTIDLYGIDMCIDLCAKLKKNYPDIGFIFSLQSVKNTKYFKKLKHRIIKNDIQHNFLFYTQPSPLYPILINSNIFVRPTNMDGDSVSIREALYFKIPTVASDVVPRPEGTVVFKNRNVEDFFSKVTDTLDNYALQKKKLETISIENNAEQILTIYQKFLNF